MKIVFGAAIALAVVLIQSLRAEDPNADKTDGDQKRILQEIATGELRASKSLLKMSKKSFERAAS